MTEENCPKSLTEAVKHFADDKNCHDFLVALRWPDGVVKCAHCGSARIGKLVASKRVVPAKVVRGVAYPEKTLTRRLWNCKGCRKQFTAKVGTIFEDSPLGLDKWFTGVWLLTNAKNGISSYEVAATLGITQKSAWHMMHRVRRILHDGSVDKLSGTIEADETYIGGLARNMHKDVKERRITGTGGKDKTAVMGMLERSTRDKVSRVRLRVLKSAKRAELQGHVYANVEPLSNVMTDAHPAYQGLQGDFEHAFVDHAIRYVEGAVHTNGLENFWCLLKRSLKGTYVRPSPFHMFRYLDAQAYWTRRRIGSMLVSSHPLDVSWTALAVLRTSALLGRN